MPLEVNETLLDDMPDSAGARMGYIEKIDLGCSKNACGNCYMKAGGDSHKPLMWAITKKGIDFMGKQTLI
ncbi:hypothetical protein [Syntrophomonas wolfei]|uniref:hypothetical protein n=1 Tax=Syntrophomonas wolfei TaxID=863 RepID=UPI0007739F7A|nr:hypothetical protein [Syntrophomonas wolfei]